MVKALLERFYVGFIIAAGVHVTALRDGLIDERLKAAAVFNAVAKMAVEVKISTAHAKFLLEFYG